MTLPRGGPLLSDKPSEQRVRAIEQAFPLDTQHISDGAIGTAQIASDAVTAAKLAPQAATLSTLSAVASADLTLTASYADVTGATVTTPNDGLTRSWLVTGTFYFYHTAANSILIGGLNVDGVLQTAAAVDIDASGTQNTATQTWIVSVAPNKVMKLQAAYYVTSGGKVLQTHTTIRAIASSNT